MHNRKTTVKPEDLPYHILKPARCCCEVSGNHHDPGPLCPVHGVKMSRRTLPTPEPPKHYRPMTYGGARPVYA